MFLRPARRVARAAQSFDAKQCTSIIRSRSLRTRPGQAQSSRQPPDSNLSEQPSENTSSQSPAQPPPDVSSVLSNLDPSENQLLAPVHVSEDKNAVLRSDHPATNILAQSGLVVTRQIEMMNIFLGFEQANRYVIMDPQGNHIGYMAEHDGGIAKTMGRQWFKTHRAFTTHVFDRHAQEVLRFHRPFSWINSRIKVYDPLEIGKYVPQSSETAVSTNVKDTTIDGIHSVSSLPIEAMRIIGETHSEWAPLRRKYNLFLAHELGTSQNNNNVAGQIGTEPIPSDLSSKQLQQVKEQGNASNFTQFAYVDEPWLSWDFSLKGADGRLIGSVNRNWRGFGRELFTDTGMYVLRMDSAALEEESQKSHLVSQSHQGGRAYGEVLGAEQGATGMTLDQRALMLATAVTVDFDYFSRHSSSGSGMFLPFWLGGGGGEAAGGAAGAGAAGAGAGAGAEGAGVAVGGAGRAAGAAGAASEIGAGEGAIAGAGSLAGYEAMQRGMGRGEGASSPPSDGGSAASPSSSSSDPSAGQPGQDGLYNDPNSPQYGGYNEDPNSLGQGGGTGQGSDSQDVWGNDSDPWSEGGNAGGGGDGGSGGGGLGQSLWDAFFGD